MTEPVLRRRRHIEADGRVVGWVVKRDQRYRAYVEHPRGGYLAAEGHSPWQAMDQAWSARCVLLSEVQETTEEER
jgi:hypothetical protein